MTKYSHSRPSDVDPRTIQDDGEAGGPNYRRVKCTNLITKEFIGYLSTRGSASTAIGDGPGYPPAMCYWMVKDGARYLTKQTEPHDRCLGVSDWWYACWALQQVRNMGYFTNIIPNQDGTLSPGTHPDLCLAGPYRYWGIDWTWWAQKGHPDILICELVD